MAKEAGDKVRTSLMKVNMPKVNYGRFLGVGAGLAAFGALAFNSFYTVEAGHGAVMFSRLSGVAPNTIDEAGTHIKFPFVEYPSVYDIRAKPHVFSSMTGSKDLQMVSISLRLLAKPQPSALPKIHKELGEDWANKVLPSVTHEVLKAVVAQFNAAQLITQRSRVSAMIGEELRRRAVGFNVLLDDVSLTHLSFSPEYSRAVEEKKIAQQEAERANILVEKAKQEKQGTIIRAEGQAQAARLIGSAAANNPGYLELLRLDNAKMISHSIQRSNNRIYLNSDNLLLDLLHTVKVDIGNAK